MSEKWYYVLNGERNGPIEFESLLELYQEANLSNNDYVWTKGLENWMKIKDLEQFHTASKSAEKDESLIPDHVSVTNSRNVSLADLEADENCIFIRIGVDRGTAPVEYGPFSIEILKKLFN